MTLPDETEREDTLIRAAQYDLSLCRLRGEPGAEVLGWRLGGRRLGPGFLSRPLALDWIARWLDEDTEAQRLHIHA